ncbi:hypothetical protein Ple7327_0525 [Pleurocapsa sp. PCC 7327]|uniref:hypothetical protein n=1 Tax=Pleurocapsa sp. PCC 7327 TaxID=118163 RepID=UPI00029FFCD8|nr:hypothetical protein [Pleurocapsa sp. PCC 7327]AFY75972.1 hypothetical protein Ple7327_0525 [Pleurocapsa sp. PCC 7327]
MNNPNILDPNSVQAYRHRVRLLGQELWEETNQLRRMNIAMLLADAATHLARLEAEELQNQHPQEFRQLLNAKESSVRFQETS